jgi:hypothetical protein
LKKTKIQERFTDYGCGFPVVLQNVPMVEFRGVWTPDIDYKKLHKSVVWALARNPTRLTGNQIKFVRNFFNLTREEFGKRFDINWELDWAIDWEDSGDDTPGIKWSLERDLRLFIMDRLGASSDAIGNLYKKLRSKLPVSQYEEHIWINMEDVANSSWLKKGLKDE